MAFNVCTSRYAHWHLDEASGTNASDSSGNGRNGTLVNMIDADWQAGKLKNCLFFDGINDYVDFGNIAAFERTQAFSVEVWIKSDVTGTHEILSKLNLASPYTGWDYFVNASALGFRLLHDITTNGIIVSAAVTVLDGAWHHIVVTYDGSSNASGCKMYVDSASKTVVASLDNLNLTIVNTTPLTMAKNQAGAFFSKLIDEVVIYNRVITQTEVTGRYNSGIGTEACRIPSGSTLLGHDF